MYKKFDQIYIYVYRYSGYRKPFPAGIKGIIRKDQAGNTVFVTGLLPGGAEVNLQLHSDQVSSYLKPELKLVVGQQVKVSTFGSTELSDLINRASGNVKEIKEDGSIIVTVKRELNGQIRLDDYHVWTQQLIVDEQLATENDKIDQLYVWLESGNYLPEGMRDFHEQKNLFKSIHHLYQDSDHKNMPSWCTGHQYTIDWFLWFMASRGYTLQKARKKNIQFLNWPNFKKLLEQENTSKSENNIS